MALVVADRVWETTSTSGTGTLTLSGAVSGYQTFAVIGDGNTTYYTITTGTDWEVGIGTYTSSGTTLSRDTVLSSSLGGTTKITVTPGSFVFVDYPASKAVYEDESGNVTGYPISGGTINNTSIGATTPSTVNATTLTGQTGVLRGTGSNLFGYSQAFDDAVWTKSNSSITANSTTAPDGTTTADTLVENTANNTHYVYASANANLFATIVTGVTYTASIFAKPAGRNRIRFAGDGSSAFLGNEVIFDVANGTVGSIPAGVTSASIVSAGNGWYRCIVVAVATGTVARPIVFLDNGTTNSYTGDGTSGVFLWGVQLEFGSTVNSYVATTPTRVYGTPTLSFSGVSSIGLESNGSLYASSAGTGNVRFYTNNVALEQMRVSNTTSAVNYVQVTGAATGSGNYTTISSQGSDAAVNLRLSAKGAATLDAQVNSNTRWKINSDGSVDSGLSASGGISFKASATGSQVNYLQSAGGVAGSSPIFSSQGSDTNIDLTLAPKNAGAVRFGTYTASALLPVAGYITIKDSGGTTRRLLVG